MIHTLKNEMERMWNQFDHKAFISNDPIQIVHQIRNLSGRTTADIEVCAILTAMVSWGQRSHIIYCAEKLMDVCGWEPGKYIKFGDFYDIPDECNIYRTLTGKIFKEVCHQLRYFYSKHDSIQEYLKNIPFHLMIYYSRYVIGVNQPVLEVHIVTLLVNVLICCCVGWFVKMK